MLKSQTPGPNKFRLSRPTHLLFLAVAGLFSCDGSSCNTQTTLSAAKITASNYKREQGTIENDIKTLKAKIQSIQIMATKRNGGLNFDLGPFNTDLEETGSIILKYIKKTEELVQLYKETFGSIVPTEELGITFYLGSIENLSDKARLGALFFTLRALEKQIHKPFPRMPPKNAPKGAMIKYINTQPVFEKVQMYKMLMDLRKDNIIWAEICEKVLIWAQGEKPDSDSSLETFFKSIRPMLSTF